MMGTGDEIKAADLPPLPDGMERESVREETEAPEAEMLPPLPLGMAVEVVPTSAGVPGGDGLPPLPPGMEQDAIPTSAGVPGDGLPPLPPGMEQDAIPTSAGVPGGDGLPPLPPGMEQEAIPTSAGVPGDGLPPLPPGMAVSRTQETEGSPGMLVLILALIACALYQGTRAWQAKRGEVVATEKIQLNAVAEAQSIQRARDAQTHVDRIVGLVKPKREATETLRSLQEQRRRFQTEYREREKQSEIRRIDAERALEEAERRKADLKEQSTRR